MRCARALLRKQDVLFALADARPPTPQLPPACNLLATTPSNLESDLAGLGLCCAWCRRFPLPPFRYVKKPLSMKEMKQRCNVQVLFPFGQLANSYLLVSSFRLGDTDMASSRSYWPIASSFLMADKACVVAC